MTRNLRGTPLNSEGFDGDIQVRALPRGLVLFVKYHHKWYEFSSARPISLYRDVPGLHDSAVKPESSAFRSVLFTGSHVAKLGEVGFNSNSSNLVIYSKDTISDTVVASSVCNIVRDNPNTSLNPTQVPTNSVNTVVMDYLMFHPTGNATIGVMDRATTGANGHAKDLKILGGAGFGAYNGSKIYINPGAAGAGGGGAVSGDIYLGYDGSTAVGDITIQNGAKLYFDGTVTASGGSYITESGTDILDFYAGGDNMLKLDETSDEIKLNAVSTIVQTAGTTYSKFSSIANTISLFQLYESGGASTDDYFTISCVEHGAATISTVDIAGANADLTINPDGDLILHNVKVQTSMRIEYDASNYVTLGVASDGHLDISGTGTDDDLTIDFDGGIIFEGASLDIDVTGDITLDAGGNDIAIKTDGTTWAKFNRIADNISGLYLYSVVGGSENDYFTINVFEHGATYLTTIDTGGTNADMVLNPNGDLTFNPYTAKVILGTQDKLYFDGGTHTYIDEESDDRLRFVVGTDEMLILDEASDAITMAATNWIAGTVSGATITEFSAANSAYAGMILGYTDIGLNEARQQLALTTSYVVPTDEFSVSFTAPPSGNVEIMIQISFSAGSSGAGDLYAGLSSTNATSGYTQLQDYHEEELIDQSGRYGWDIVQNYWTLTGLTAGTAYEYWAGFKSSSTTGSPTVQWGGSTSGHNPDFIMKATALPATITT